MKVLIVEDEHLASERLEHMISTACADAEVVARLDSVEETIAYFNKGNSPDLSFMDIQLSDGLSLDIFKQAQIHSPVIFTTAYDAYALEAFKVNSIDYLLKPIDPKELQRALTKFQTIAGPKEPAISDHLATALKASLSQTHKRRFVIRNGSNLKIKPVSEVAYIRAEGRAVYIYTQHQGKRYLIDHTMEELENDLLDPEHFFRINRQFFVRAENILEARSYINSRLKIILDSPCEYELIVSRERVPHFKDWIAR